jgi:hypothetical protein
MPPAKERVDVEMNGRTVVFQEPKQLLECLLLQILEVDIKYSPVNVLHKNTEAIFSLVLEYCKEKKVSGRDITSKKKMLDYCKTRENFVSQFYDLLLSLSGCSPLHGFGFSNSFGDKIEGNSERKRISYEKR